MLSRDGLALMGLVGSSRLRRTSVSFDFLDVASAADVAGRWTSPRPPRSFRSPGDPRGFPTASPSSPPHLAMRVRVPAFLVFAPLQSCMTVAPVGITRSPLLGLVRSESPGGHHCPTPARPCLLSPPSTCSLASTPTSMSPPKFRVRICLIRTMFRPRGFSPPRRFAPPFAPLPELPRDHPFGQCR